MDRVLARLDAILNDEFSSASDAFGKSVGQKVAEISATGNRFSTALRNDLEALAKEELRRRATAILECSKSQNPPDLIRLPLDGFVSWAEGRLLREKAKVEAVIAGVNMGKIENNASFLDEVARSSADRLKVELEALVTSELDVLAEAPDFVRQAKWIYTKGRANYRWVALGIALLLILAVVPRLLPPWGVPVVGPEGEVSPTPGAAVAPAPTSLPSTAVSAGSPPIPPQTAAFALANRLPFPQGFDLVVPGMRFSEAMNLLPGGELQSGVYIVQLSTGPFSNIHFLEGSESRRDSDPAIGSVHYIFREATARSVVKTELIRQLTAIPPSE